MSIKKNPIKNNNRFISDKQNQSSESQDNRKQNIKKKHYK